MTDTPAARLLACGLDYEENGQEVHPHPECPIGQAAAPAVQAPATDRAALRDRIAAALYERERPPRDPHWPKAFAADREVFEAMADAVLAVLPAPTDRAAVLREAADRYAKLTDQNEAYDREHGQLDEVARIQHGTVRDVVTGLRRMADEAQPAEAHSPTSTWTVESPRRDNWASWGATYDDRDWAQERYESAVETAPARPFRLVRATTTYTVEAEHQPAAGAQQDEAQP
jgi:hypothetical protein